MGKRDIAFIERQKGRKVQLKKNMSHGTHTKVRHPNSKRVLNGSIKQRLIMKDNTTNAILKRQLTATIVLAGISLVLAFISIGAYYYFDGILREFFFR